MNPAFWQFLTHLEEMMILAVFGGIIGLIIFALLLTLGGSWVWGIPIFLGSVISGLLAGALCEAAGRADEEIERVWKK